MPGMLTALVKNESNHRRTKGDRTCRFQDRKSRKKCQNKTGNIFKANRDPFLCLPCPFNHLKPFLVRLSVSFQFYRALPLPLSPLQGNSGASASDFVGAGAAAGAPCRVTSPARFRVEAMGSMGFNEADVAFVTNRQMFFSSFFHFFPLSRRRSGGCTCRRHWPALR